MLRPSQLAFRQLRSPVVRNTFQRRFASNEESTKLVGPMDNAFNRERLAVREHAAHSAGMAADSNTFTQHADILRIDLWRRLCI